MTLDLVIMMPEFFLLFGFLVLLGYGTGGLVSPVAEMITVADLKGKTFSSMLMPNVSKNPTAGPNHAASALSYWAVFWCLLCALLLFFSPLHSVFLGGCFQKDAYSLQLGGILFLAAVFVLRVSLGWQKTAAIRHTEYVYLAMLALMGQYLLIQTTDLMAMYLCLELQSFSLVVLCGLNYKSAYSIEAAMKYFLLSAFRSCLLLLGIGFLYLQTGETTISSLSNLVFRTQTEPSLLLLAGIWFVTIGLLWKLAAAPLHFWVPDVYTGAWSSVSLWITVLPKIAVLGFWTHHWQNLWRRTFGNTLSIFRILSMLLGRLAPLAQTNLKRLLAYSSIGHMGLLLMPLCGSGFEATGALWTYMFIYILINLGVWGLIMQEFTRSNTPSVTFSGPQYIWDLKGLSQSAPCAAFRWAVCVVGLMGLPPVYGFSGKLGILYRRLNNGLYITVAVALLYTLVGRVYYLKILKVSYIDTRNIYNSYSGMNSISAYIIATSVALLMIGLWHPSFLFTFGHLLALQV
ncbi:nuoN (mitochondrion) [Scenedesmus sp. PABB004]|nr:nuoN [Scenedesmus sp. PABB004]